MFQYETEKLDLVKSLETELKRDRSVLRYLTVSLCKDALEYNARRAKVFCRIQVPNGGAEWPLSKKFGCSAHFSEKLLMKKKV